MKTKIKTKKKAAEAKPAAPIIMEIHPGTVWKGPEGQRVRVTFATRVTVDFSNLDSGGNGVLARAWFLKHYQEAKA